MIPPSVNRPLLNRWDSICVLTGFENEPWYKKLLLELSVVYRPPTGKD